jgi:hypothetical protein
LNGLALAVPFVKIRDAGAEHTREARSKLDAPIATKAKQA